MNFELHEIEWTDQKVARFWDSVALNNSLSDLYFTKILGREIIKDIDQEIGLSNKKILDFGSGPGYLFSYLKETGKSFEYSALDFSSDSINQLKEKFQNDKGFKEAFFISGFPTQINQKFDIIICCEVIEHLSDQMLLNVVTELKKLLSKNGYLYITTPNDEELDKSKVTCPDCGCTFHRWQHMRKWTEGSLKKYMANQGVETSKVKSLNFYSESSSYRKFKNFLKKSLGRETEKPNLCFIGKNR
jgi:2-polyprenyl-3-methyl-5-hydroxy-6-metoxy-1,4-benzoquinol methylase